MPHTYRAVGVSQDEHLFPIEIEVELDPDKKDKDPIYTALSDLGEQLDEEGIEPKYPRSSSSFHKGSLWHSRSALVTGATPH